MHPRDQTIYALSSGRPPTAIAIVRVSGTRAGIALERLAKKRPIPRAATHVLLADEKLGPIDDAMVLWFPAPASATGEDTAEFHIHGGRAVLVALFDALAAIPGLRPAEPGEFTRRAFENGKLDLTEAEGLDDLIHADTDRQRKQALRQLKGLLGDKARNWRQQIIEALALVEVGIDFSDEGDVSAELMAPALEKAEALCREIEEVLSAQGRGERLREGLVVAIAGQPNVGKSTLMNQLARRDVAIVSPHAGTTRDVLEVQLDLDGYPVTVIDTAGIRETIDPVEEEGVRRARARAGEADLVLWLVDSADAARPEGWLTESDAPIWIVRTKTDVPAAALEDATFSISAERGDGMSELMSALVEFASQYFGQGEAGFITRDRQRDLLRRTVDLLRHAATSAQQGDELVAEDLRAAAYQLGRLLGQVDVEDVLDSIFRDFCIGK
ncbi:tRNA uridine-5-carboxymethylaminomethyl(34) synthesis GTPase MnmE [Rhodopseudomonas boonkerdii]|uniref:tRNA uridine-5-carboxymethylaminomethyl(34) synthesis GTPase MnmE n=1 Tax=Rhodopseudomonas boonkerdii TaxID=475937 RepID=UPI001E57283A|nr:tRNA uridine-5-carboxymethylaminomethyl(34) synthesis GTPase MnmE [Rhodopseudomonas boonkerdii]UGV24441.1 tRNA uridine-5-carboxymethylaminomethyl(34) synthesis GTPase MnmE [Rhodopseudomonas boonkerdii]